MKYICDCCDRIMEQYIVEFEFQGEVFYFCSESCMLDWIREEGNEYLLQNILFNYSSLKHIGGETV